MSESHPDEGVQSNFAFVGAVHELLASARSHKKIDILLAAVLQALYEEPRAVREIAARTGQIWPQAAHTESDIRQALAIGEELRLVAQLEALDAEPIWTLTKEGVEDVRQHVEWVKELRDRIRDEVRARAIDGLGTELSVPEADLVVDALVRALATTIRSTQGAYEGQIDGLLGTGRAAARIAPRNLDRAQLLAAVGEGEGPTLEFVRGLCMSAVDPLDPFGNELVSHITTGCILHAFVAGADRHKVITRIGRPNRERAILDTPLLIDLLGPKRLSVGLKATIRHAVGAGWEVIALQHSIDEAAEVLRRDVPTIEETLCTAIKERRQQDWYASLAEDQLPALCVEVLRDGTYKSLQQLLTAAASLQDRLEELGVVVREHGNVDRVPVSQLIDALKAELSEHNGRSEVVLCRDAETMAVAWRRRKSQRGSQWPGAWIVTKDRHMAPAYRGVARSDKVSLTLTAGQWATLLSVTAEPAAIEQLAKAAAQQYLDEAAWTLPIRYPVEVARALAQQLSPEQGGSETDIRVAQMSLDEALNGSSSNSIAAAVLAERARRVKVIHETDRQRLTDGLVEAQEHDAAATARAHQVEVESLKQQQQIGELNNNLEQLRLDKEWLQTQLKRSAWAGAILVIAIAAVVVSGFVAEIQTTMIFCAGLLVVGYGAYRWCTERDARLLALVVGTLIDLVGFISAARDLLTR